jgi:uncharacterized membrane protein YccC
MNKDASGVVRPEHALPEANRWLKAIGTLIPKVLFGLRVWVAVCLALYIAFWLELDRAYWAGVSAAIVCQPSVGSSLRKGAARMVGTVVGAMAVIALTALVVQDRVTFLLGLAVWSGACAFGASLLRDSASYGAALAGFTAVIVAGDELGATGGASGDAFMLAITRASEICIGIVSASVVLASTDLGSARRRLAAALAALGAEIASRLGTSLSLVGADQANVRSMRHDLATRIVALSAIVDEALGEATDLRYRLGTLQAATEGLIAALSGWRTAANCLEQLGEAEGRRESTIVLKMYPTQTDAQLAKSSWTEDPASLVSLYRAAVRSLVLLPADTPSLRLLADGVARALRGLSLTADAVTALVDSSHKISYRPRFWFHGTDVLPAAIAAVRVFATIVVIELIWIVTAWPNGATAMGIAAIGIILFSPREAQAFSEARAFTLGVALASVVAAIVRFAVLPGMETFAGLSLVIGAVLVPTSILSMQAWQTSVFKSMTVFFFILLMPANLMSFDTAEFYNAALASIVGMAMAAIGFLLLPPLSAAARVRRMLRSTLRDLRRLAAGELHCRIDDWEGRLYRRLSEMPSEVDAKQLARFVAMLSMGSTMIRFRRVAPRFALEAETDIAFAAVAKRDSRTAQSHLALMDSTLDKKSRCRAQTAAGLRARGNIQAMLQTLAGHGDYFDGSE